MAKPYSTSHVVARVHADAIVVVSAWRCLVAAARTEGIQAR
ncbi:hypothetical protein [Agromyces seonyuensis]|nr:hypothetical protein [Agromyces seonyuensis]